MLLPQGLPTASEGAPYFPLFLGFGQAPLLSPSSGPKAPPSTSGIRMKPKSCSPLKQYIPIQFTSNQVSPCGRLKVRVWFRYAPGRRSQFPLRKRKQRSCFVIFHGPVQLFNLRLIWDDLDGRSIGKPGSWLEERLNISTLVL